MSEKKSIQVRDLIAELQRHDPLSYINVMDGKKNPSDFVGVEGIPGSHIVNIVVSESVGYQKAIDEMKEALKEMEDSNED